MSSFKILTVGTTGKPAGKDTSANTFDFLSVKVGPSALEMKETTGAFDFSGKKLSNILAGAASGEAIEYAQLNTALALYVPLTQKGAAGGVASLDGGGKVPVAQLPNSILEYISTWDATANTPTLADYASGAAAGTHVGDVYRVSVAGSQNLGSGSISFVVGDYAIVNNSGKFEKSHSGADAVTSVNGFAGIVVLATTDVAEGSNLYYTQARFDTAFAAKSTTNLSEGANLYYTQTRFDSAFTAKSTSNLSEGSNLYFTVARAKSAAVANVITSGVTDVAPSQDAVFNALALKADASVASRTNDNAGAITVRQIVYVKSTGNVDLASAAIATLDETQLGYVIDASIAAAASGRVSYQTGATIPGFSGLTAGKTYYVSKATPGAIALYTGNAYVTGDMVVVVGKAVSATELVFAPKFEFVF